MSLNKRIKGDYTIESIDSGDQIIVNQAGGITIAGDLTAIGAATATGTLTVTDTTTVTDINVIDNVIVLNSNEAGPGITHVSQVAGIDVDRGDGVTAGHETVGIRYNDNIGFDQWQATDDGTIWYALNPALGGSGLFNVVEDLTPQLGANLDVNGFDITSLGALKITATGSPVRIDPSIALPVLPGSFPGSTADTTKIYAAAIGDGDTGMYVVNHVNAAAVTSELISNRKAIIYSLIF